MLDLDKPIVVQSDKLTLHKGVVPRTLATLVTTLAERGDPRGVFPAEVVVEWPKTAAR